MVDAGLYHTAAIDKIIGHYGSHLSVTKIINKPMRKDIGRFPCVFHYDCNKTCVETLRAILSCQICVICSVMMMMIDLAPPPPVLSSFCIDISISVHNSFNMM